MKNTTLGGGSHSNQNIKSPKTQGRGTSSGINSQNSGNNSNRSQNLYQPILRSKDGHGGTNNVQSSNASQQQQHQSTSLSTQGAQLRKQGSGPIEKKNQTISSASQKDIKNATQNSSQNKAISNNNNNSQQIQQNAQSNVIKGTTFNYEDLQKQRSRDNTPISNQKKQQINKYDPGSSKQLEEDQYIDTTSTKTFNHLQQSQQPMIDQDDEISMTESEVQEQRLRPSDEVQYTSKKKSGQNDYDFRDNNRLSIQPPIVTSDEYPNNRMTTGSFQVIHETQKSDNKLMTENGNYDNQHYEVIQEEVKESNFMKYNRDERVLNSDFKRFNMDDDNIQNQQALRLTNCSKQLPQNNLQFNPNSFQPTALDFSNPLGLDQQMLKQQQEMLQQQLMQLQQQHSQQVQQQNMRYNNNQQNVNRTRNEDYIGFPLDESSLKGSTHQLFLHNQSNIMVDNNTTNSFLQPIPDNIQGIQDALQQSQRDLLIASQQFQLQQNQAHILSFSQTPQNQNIDPLNDSLSAIVHLPLQKMNDNNYNTNNTQNDDININQDGNRPLSPTAEMQQRRLNEILRSSRTDTQSLNNSIQHDKMDEKQLNSMIDLEKNFVIMQYENILQQLNIEFQKLLQKQKESEEQLVQKDQVLKTQSRMLTEKDEQQFQIEQVNRQLSSQVQELLQELEIVTVKMNQQSQQQQFLNEEQQMQLSSTFREDTQHRIEKDYLESKVQQLQNKLNFSEHTERELRDQIELIQTKLRNTEQKLRMKEEEMFQMSRDNTTLQRDIQNAKELEYQLRQEIQGINSQRIQQDNEIQELRHQISNLQIQSRQKESDLDQVIRENRNLKGTVDLQQQNQQETLNELNNAKQYITDLERTKIQMKSHIDKVNREHTQNQQEIIRLQDQLKMQANKINENENSYNQEINQLINQNKQLQQQLKQAQQQSQWKRDDQDENTQRPWEAQNKKKISFNDEPQYRSNNPQNLNNTINYKNQLEFTQPLQETHNTFYSPQRNQRSNAAFQPSSSFNDQNKSQGIKDAKSTIAWPHQYGGNTANTVQNQEKQYPPPKQQFMSPYDKNRDDKRQSFGPNYCQQVNISQQNNRQEQSQGRRGTIQNQNQSSLPGLLSWEQSNNGQHQHHLSIGSRSLERKPDMNQMQTSMSEKQLNQQSYAKHGSLGRGPLQQNESQVQWATLSQKQPFNQQNQQSNSQPSHNNSTSQHNSSTQNFNYFRNAQQQYQDQDLQPAGKKTIATHLSPLGKKDKNFEQQLNSLQNKLCVLQIDKERVENDYRKIGHPKNKQQIEKKQELEFEVEIITKNIQNLKSKLRELNAFQQ